MEIVQIIAIVLAAVGAVNWGLVGLFKFDLVALIAGGMKFGDVNVVSRIIYILVARRGRDQPDGHRRARLTAALAVATRLRGVSRLLSVPSPSVVTGGPS